MPQRLPGAAIRAGAALSMPVPGRMQVGFVLEYFSATQSYRVRTGFGELSEVPRLCRDPGDNTILPIDTMVALHNELGFWAIDAVIKQTPLYARELNRITLTEAENVGGADPQNEQGESAASFRGAGDPKDMLPDDWVRKTADGNFVGVLSGGMNVMQSAPFAQIRTHALTNSVEVFAHEYRHLSSFGDFVIKNDGGKTSVIWRGGSDQETENGANATNWTIRLDAGAEGDLFRLRVTTPQGQTLSEVHMSAEGRLELVGVGGVDVTSGSDWREDTLGSKAVFVRGGLSEKIEGSAATSFGGTRTTQVAQNDTVTVGGGFAQNVTGNFVQTVGGAMTVAVTESSRIDVTKGYLDIVLADTAKGGVPGNSLCFVNQGGDILAQPSATSGKFIAFGSMPGSVLLGADAVPLPRQDGSMTSSGVAPYSAMMYEYFNAMMTTLLNWLDTHTHPSAMGPTGPPLIPSSPIVTPQVSPVQSQRVKIGG